MTRIITIASAKGGVGKTTLCSNLAAGLTNYGKSVIAIAGNLTTSNLGLHLGVSMYPVTLQDVIKGRAKIQDAVYHHWAGFRFVPADVSISKIMSPRSKEFFNAFYGLAGDADFILIDSAAGLGREAKAAIEAADEVIVITNPEMTALTDALKLTKIADKFGTHPIGVVINKIRGDRHEVPVQEALDFLELPLLGKVNDDRNVRKAISNKEPVILHVPRSRAAHQFRRIAARLAGEEEPAHHFFHKLFGWL